MENNFHKSKSMRFPREVFAGHGVLEEIVNITKGFAGPGIIITGKKTYEAAGKAAESFLKDAGFDITVVFSGAADSTSLKTIREKTKEISPGFIVGAGGGSKIDVSKLVSFEIGVPFISVPTNASHDGVSSSMVSIKDETGTVTSINTHVPYSIIADTAVIHKAPYRMLAAGCADVLSNITAVMDWKLAVRLYGEEFSSTACALSEMSAKNIIEDAETIQKNIEESVWTAIKPVIASGLSMGIAGSSRPASGAEHMFSHALDMLYPERKSLHGEQVGVGTIVSMYLHGGDWKTIRDTLMILRSPVNAKELGVPENILVEALVKANTIRKRATILGKAGITKKAAEEALRTTKII